MPQQTTANIHTGQIKLNKVTITCKTPSISLELESCSPDVACEGNIGLSSSPKTQHSDKHT